MRTIDLEAHFITKDHMKYLRSRKGTPREEAWERNIRLWMDTDLWSPRSFKLEDQLLEVGSKRIGEMGSAGVDVQVLSLTVPGCGQFESSEGATMAKQTNDELSEVIIKYLD